MAALTIDALRAYGVDVTVLTPPDSRRAGRLHGAGPRWRAWTAAAAAGARHRLPATIARHAWSDGACRVSAHLQARPVDAIHVEQLQALHAAEPAIDAGVPSVLRMHNVESDVWHAMAGRRPWIAPLLRREARRLAAFESTALARVGATVTLTEEDRCTLTRLAPDARVTCIAAPAPMAAASPPAPLDGTPACVWLGTAGWAGNDDGLAWLRREVWPAITGALPGARLHVFSGQPSSPAAGVVGHGPAASSTDAFAPRSILLLPLRDAPGVRMRVLEAWANAVPVVATPAAVRGLHVHDGENVLVAADAGGFATQIARLHTSPDLRQRLQAGGRAAIDRDHAPAAVAARLLACYEDVIRRSRSR